ncbi:MAG: hypothetical protein MHM6MM_008854 [Cercozoa sp. M6MM]
MQWATGALMQCSPVSESMRRYLADELREHPNSLLERLESILNTIRLGGAVVT